MDGFEGEKVAVYARVSTSRQIPDDGVMFDQIVQCEKFAIDNGAEVFETYAETDASGTSSRPVYQQMLTDARAGRFTVIVAFSRSRLFRDATDYVKAREELHSAGITLISLTQ